MTEDEMNHREIIIVKRADPGHDDGHHGGVWKIAFADFMTAMMAFFLVMWLINAANEETKKAVASYFTPIKLTDRTSNPKGLKDPKYGKAEESTEEEEDDQSTFASGGKLNQKVPDPVQVNEQAIFTDPYAILSEIAGGIVSGEQDRGEAEEQKEQSAALGISGGEAFHDPFDPSSWNTELGLARRDAKGGSADTSENGEMAGGSAPRPSDARDAAALAETANSKTKPQLNSPERPEMADKAGPAKEGELRPGVAPAGEKRAGTKDKSETPADGKTTAGEASPEGEAAAASLRKALAGLTGKKGGGPHIEIEAQGSGVLISVADEFKFGMFDIGSSVPRKETVLAMAEIGKALSQIEGGVIVAGHTDARKYRSDDYDNWRLSTDRAHIARYMLIRGGLDESRVEKIEGFAASKLKLADDPFAAGNRRIEIFVRLP